MNIAEELDRLHQLHQAGGLSDEEFAKAKASLLNATAGRSNPIIIKDEAGAESQARQWAMLLHLSLLLGFVVPILGLVAPIVIWQIKKTDLPALDVHGKIVMDWIISLVLYAVAGALLIFVLIGIPLLIALGVVAVVFPVIGGIKANNGEVWPYPLSIAFLK